MSLRGLRAIGVLASTVLFLAACGGHGGETTVEPTTPPVEPTTPPVEPTTNSPQPEEDCSPDYPQKVSGAGVLSACTTSDGSYLSVVNISNSVLDLRPTSSVTAWYYPSDPGTSVSEILLHRTVSGGCDSTKCRLRPRDGAVYSGTPPFTVRVGITPVDTIMGDAAHILGGWVDRYATNPSGGVRGFALRCAAGLDDLRSPEQFPEDEIRDILATYPSCKSTYRAIFGDAAESPSVADDLLSSLKSEVKGNFVDELLQALAKIHAR
jgi:hypothetical protein